ncbi:hypothetical protein ACLIYM_02440 [Streptomyces fenghuangensis]|uniref:hypothetical protein n=1 Tax=Streptomyces sp. ICN903 TaxID=2964654 RepID=UPI001EDB1DD8|nr:hypothetical protein [Streptomyces sp. ICN903]MCG3043084.1 hypothetical protein [Streptomyces sp. ICN903]
MSSLWNARIEEIGDRELTLRLTAAHPDSGDVPDSKVFALRLIVDGRERAAVDTSVRGRDADPGAAAEIIDTVTVTDRRNLPFEERAEKRRIEDRLRARGLSPEDARNWQTAFEDAWRELWHDASRLPNARITIRVRDTSWLAGLGEGDGWESAAYG